RFSRDWSSDVCSSDLVLPDAEAELLELRHHAASPRLVLHQHARRAHTTPVLHAGAGLGEATSRACDRIGNRLCAAQLIERAAVDAHAVAPGFARLLQRLLRVADQGVRVLDVMPVRGDACADGREGKRAGGATQLLLRAACEDQCALLVRAAE